MTTIEELSNQIIPMLIPIAFAWYISHFAKASIPRLLFFSFGAYFTIAGATEFDRLIGIGLVAPHLKFFFSWVIDIFDGFRRGTIDTYYAFLTIYYQTRNLFIRAYRFFGGRKSSNKKSTGSNYNDYYEKQEYRQYEDFGQSSQSHNRREERQKEHKQEEYGYQESYSSDEETHQYDSYEEPSSSYQEKDSEDDIAPEFKQFFSTSYHEVLGVSVNDDFATIKKKYRKLQRQYHPDLNMDQKEFYTEITARINNAYEFFEKNYKV